MEGSSECFPGSPLPSVSRGHSGSSLPPSGPTLVLTGPARFRWRPVDGDPPCGSSCELTFFLELPKPFAGSLHVWCDGKEICMSPALAVAWASFRARVTLGLGEISRSHGVCRACSPPVSSRCLAYLDFSVVGCL